MSRMFLQREVSIQDLEKGIEFEVDNDNNNYDSSDETFDDVIYNKNKGFSTDYEDTDKLYVGNNVPFNVLKEKMQSICADGLILKEILKHGYGDSIPDKSVVFLHYDAYLEGQKESFDSTRLRGKPFKFLFGDGNLIPGLEMGIQTMKKGEYSRILVSPRYAFGEMGCPPRIPPNTEILYEVQILNYFAGKDSVEFEELSPEDQKKAPFEKLIGVYHCDSQIANNLFHKGQYKLAIARYCRVKNLLEDVSVANEEDDEKRKGYLLKLYLNLSQCYLNVNVPQKAIIYADLSLKIDPKHPKGLFRMGRALLLTGSYDRAQYYLCLAKKYKPYESSINAALQELEKKRKSHLDWEKMFCKRMLGSEETKIKSDQFDESPEFVQVIDDEINDFLKTDEKELIFPPSYIESQLEVVKFLATAYDLAFVSKIHNGKKIVKVVKKKL
ncbi:inactive peptidyl-prolyl cis-trans isomerase FKBP6 [Caerostris darwini]|uniref:peptidylprolyl isomerase n=1 Tax=Caerostris darwini TaxID=1538125 RepID=A0AAV4SYC9_9ARAC|nr:inactive peptidyl-prolyl cis-trans isomerase FKBP6 [Caerostris darwini]